MFAEGREAAQDICPGSTFLPSVIPFMVTGIAVCFLFNLLTRVRLSQAEQSMLVASAQEQDQMLRVSESEELREVKAL